MSKLTLTFLGTGSSSQIPVYNCTCIACQRAHQDPRWVRRPCSAVIENTHGKWLIDSGLMDLTTRFAPHELKGILQTHYHADHAQGLLHLRWGVGLKIPVYGPVDDLGFADLYKHPGILDFQLGFQAFDTQRFPGFSVMAIPLQHSRPTMGYLISSLEGENIAYLTDTCGLADDVMQFLSALPLKYAIVDCSYPSATQPRNHNDLTMALEMLEQLAPEQGFLTHIDHRVDAYLMEHPEALPEDVSVAQDGMKLVL